MGGMGGMPGMGGMGMPGLGFDPQTTTALLQDPIVQNMMQQMFSNPELMQQMMNSNPMMQQMLNSNPGLRNMMSNPEFLRQMSNPQTINSLIQMQNAMQQLQGTGFFPPTPNPFLPQQPQNQLTPPSPSLGTTPTTPTTPTIPTTNPTIPTTNPSTPTTGQVPFDYSRMFQMFGGMPGLNPFGAPNQQQQPQQQQQDPPDVRFRVQLEQLKELGFLDQQANLNALIATSGNVELAIDRLLLR